MTNPSMILAGYRSYHSTQPAIPCPNPPVPEHESRFAARGAQAAAALVTSVKANLPQGQAALRKASAVRGGAGGWAAGGGGRQVGGRRRGRRGRVGGWGRGAGAGSLISRLVGASRSTSLQINDFEINDFVDGWWELRSANGGGGRE